MFLFLLPESGGLLTQQDISVVIFPTTGSRGLELLDGMSTVTCSFTIHTLRHDGGRDGGYITL